MTSNSSFRRGNDHVHENTDYMTMQQGSVLTPSTSNPNFDTISEATHVTDCSTSNPKPERSLQSPPQILKSIGDVILEKIRQPVHGLLAFNDDPQAYEHADSAKSLFGDALSRIEKIRPLLKDSDPGLATSIVSSCLQNDIIHAVYSSNFIERTGLKYEPTRSLCQRLFTGDIIEPQGTVDEQKAQRETFQHALAFLHIVHSMVVLDEDLSERLICSTHRILLSHIDIKSHDGRYGVPWHTYAGKYRRRHVAAGSCNFTTPTAVSRKMAEFIESYNADVATTKKLNSLDPFTLAAKYCNDFVMIHPFSDGNGRMCRLILNAILLKYANCVISIGSDEDLRHKYIGIQRRAGDRMEGSGELARLVLEASMRRFRKLRKNLKKLETKLETKSERGETE